jgi:hypothetical protein
MTFYWEVKILSPEAGFVFESVRDRHGSLAIFRTPIIPAVIHLFWQPILKVSNTNRHYCSWIHGKTVLE